MRQTLSRGVFVAAAATSVLSLYGSPAFADSSAQGAAHGSAGVLSGNTVQVPVEVPVNACGNTVDGAAALNPAFGNKCSNGHATPRPTPPPSYGDDCGDQGAYGHTPSGDCSTPPATPTPPPSQTPPPPRHHTPPPVEHTPPPVEQTPPQMAQTGSGDTAALWAASAASAALIAGGTVLYRRGRAAGSHR
ncbi:chaplin [Streptomyces sp. NPDC047017]|uniref:chaplin n=1 Tax=Streptomyces sp. NPDC047017 TaxID=3155024 RepID=UPI0033DC8DE7